MILNHINPLAGMLYFKLQWEVIY